MGKADREREMFACMQIANQLNIAEGTDYRAEPGEDPPDAWLVSPSGRYPRRALEVVTTPFDGSITRRDHKNYSKLERKLEKQLIERRQHKLRVSVCWSETAVRHGVQDSVISGLADIIIEHPDTKGTLESEDTWERSPEVSDAFHYINILRLPYEAVEVTSYSGGWLRRDGGWIEQAIDKKRRRYGTAGVKDVTLVIDGSSYVHSEQIESFGGSHSVDQLPFFEIWVVNLSGGHRLKPLRLH